LPTLSILRHAKAIEGDRIHGDFDRVLSRRGEQAARTLGAWMQRHAVAPDLVLSSPSARTRQTCELAFGEFTMQPHMIFEEQLYLATCGQLMARIRKVRSDVSHLMLVGHNPGLHDLARDLISSGPNGLRAELDAKLPTGGLVVLELGGAFGEIAPGTARLIDFIKPKSLAADRERGQ
jgi:phosphohistidine phosphatase